MEGTGRRLWEVSVSKVVVLPSGARVRGRPLSEAPDSPAGFLLALADGPLPEWPHRRVDWPDFGLPRDRRDAIDALREALRRAREGELVEVACHGGHGRTGTAIAALAIMDGVPARKAVRWVREHYHPKAVETPWQRWWLRTVPVTKEA
jgi:protein-tyrosine phosphatase